MIKKNFDPFIDLWVTNIFTFVLHAKKTYFHESHWKYKKTKTLLTKFPQPPSFSGGFRVSTKKENFIFCEFFSKTSYISLKFYRTAEFFIHIKSMVVESAGLQNKMEHLVPLRVTHTCCSQPTLTQASRFYLNIQLVLFVEYITGKYSHSVASINVLFPCAL